MSEASSIPPSVQATPKHSRTLQQQVDMALAPVSPRSNAAGNNSSSDVTKPTQYQRVMIPFTTMEETCQLLNKESLVAISRGDFEAAATYLHEAMSYASSSSSQVYHKEMAGTLNNLGCLAKRLGNYVDAKKYLQDAVSSEVAVFGEAKASTQLNLSTVYTGLGQVSAALLLAQQVVDRTIPVQGDDFATIALHNLAVAQLCSTDVKLRKAGVESLKAALRISNETLGPDHELTYTIEQKLGKMHQQKAEMRKKGDQAALTAGGGDPSRQPAPPPGASTSHRQAASRALRALDFATPTEDPDTPAPGSAKKKPHDVMAGATFVSGASAPPTDGKETTQETASVITTSDIHPVGNNQSNEQPSSVQQLGVEAPVKASSTSSSLKESSGLTSKALAAHTSTVGQERAVTTRSRSRNSEYRPFMRFAADLQTVPPPMPISFKDVKAEARIKAGEAATRDVVVPKDEEKAGVHKEQISIFKKSVEGKRKRQEMDILEEEKIQEDQKKQAEQAIIKAKDDIRHAAALQLRQKYAARKVCKHMTAWWRRTHEASTRPRRLNAKTKDQERDEGLARSVAKFARRWLHKTAGQRLLVRLCAPRSGRKLEYSAVVAAIQTVQRAWKTLRARRDHTFLTQLKQTEKNAVFAEEHKIFAAMTMQRWIRCFLARNKMSRERAAQYTGHIVVMQRWGRMMLFRRANIMSVLSEGRKTAFAATKIQAQWRGHAARLEVAVLRLKRKIRRMRERERNAIIKMQRAGRGYRYRVCFQEAQREHRLAEMERKRPKSPKGVKARRESQVDLLLQLQNVYPQGMGRQEEMRHVAEEEREFYLHNVVDEEARRKVEQHSQRISRHEVELVLAHEQNIRQHELDTLRQERSAKTIQRRWRRWWYSLNDDRRHRLEYYRAELQYAHYLAKEKNLQEQIRREKLQLENDLAKDAREEKHALQQEAAETSALIQHMPPVGPVRPIEEREAAAKQLKLLRGDLERQNQREHGWLRTEENPSGVRTFRTVKEKHREDKAKFYRSV